MVNHVDLFAVCDAAFCIVKWFLDGRTLCCGGESLRFECEQQISINMFIYTRESCHKHLRVYCMHLIHFAVWYDRPIR